MPDDLQAQYRASYRRMEDGTKEEYHAIFGLLKKFELGLADRVLGALDLLKGSYPDTKGRYSMGFTPSTASATSGSSSSQPTSSPSTAILVPRGSRLTLRSSYEMRVRRLRTSPGSRRLCARRGKRRGCEPSRTRTCDFRRVYLRRLSHVVCLY